MQVCTNNGTNNNDNNNDNNNMYRKHEIILKWLDIQLMCESFKQN